MFLDNYHKIHFIGIGGIGVSALAKLFLDKNASITGSDLMETQTTKELKEKGAQIIIGQHCSENLSDDTDLVIYSPAVPDDNLELKKTRELKIKCFSYPQALGELTKDYYSIAISGMHGKSTTCAMLGFILQEAGFNPTVIVGSKLKLFSGGNERLGKSKYLVVEACEWKAHFLNLWPKIIILTNIEPEHLDYYKDLNDIKKQFGQYVVKLPENGYLIANTDDKNVMSVAKSAKCKDVTYGLKAGDYKITDFNFKLKIPGVFNLYNALAASVCAKILGVSQELINKSLAGFPGIWRRFEVKGEIKGITIIDDYAHHPTEIKATLKTAKEYFKNKRILCVFQPHNRERTIKLFNDFVKSFSDCEKLVLTEIFDVAGREHGEKISSKDLADKIIKKGKDVVFIKDLKDIAPYLIKNAKSGDVIITMGAGDITKVSDDLVERLKKLN